MNKIILFFCLSFATRSFPQTNIYCEGLEKLTLKAFVVVSGNSKKEFIRKGELIQYDLWIGLNDTTFKIVGFNAAYNCHSDFLFDINEKNFSGNKIKANDPFIKQIRVGEILVLDCINIEKKGKRYLIPMLHFEITN